jgi:pSer/pThr/pTyr-binding forkhead associated (FHA) protein
MYVLLNCLTLGIYGFITSQRIGNEINAICKGDGERPKFNYIGALLIRGIPTAIGLIFGLIAGIVVKNILDIFDVFGSYGSNISSLMALDMDDPFGALSSLIGSMEGIKVIVVFASMLVFGIIFTFLGTGISGMYLNYWWYKQAHRLKINAYRYDIEVKERGSDIFLFRTVLGKLFLPITVILFALSLLVPGLIALLIIAVGKFSMGAFAAAVVIMTLAAIPLMAFGCELTTGSFFSFFFITKNLNRYADVYHNGPKPFDPMGYEYYPSVDNYYINSLPDVVYGPSVPASRAADYNYGESDTSPLTAAADVGSIIGVKGNCGGYTFNITTGEEIIIGKDAKMSSVVIDKAYKEISRKHVGVSYDAVQDAYRVTDYSSNGTWVNGERLKPGVETIQRHGAVLVLANGKNSFRLG